MSKKKHYEVVDQEGLECPRCGKPSETRRHLTPLSEKIKNQPFYFTVWFTCNSPECKTTTFMSEDYKVWNKNGAAKNFQLLQEDQETINFIKHL